MLNEKYPLLYVKITVTTQNSKANILEQANLYQAVLLLSSTNKNRPGNLNYYIISSYYVISFYSINGFMSCYWSHYSLRQT